MNNLCQRLVSPFETDRKTGCASGGEIMMEGIIGGLKMKRGTGLSRWMMDNRGFEETRGPTGFSKLLFYLCVRVLESQGDQRVPMQRRGKQHRRFFFWRGESEQRLGSERRRGELWLLSWSPWWLLLCCFSLQTFVAHFSVSFSALRLCFVQQTQQQTSLKSLEIHSSCCWLKL